MWACAADIWEALSPSSLKSQTGFHGLIILWPDVRQSISRKCAGADFCSISRICVAAAQGSLSPHLNSLLPFLRRVYWKHIFQFKILTKRFFKNLLESQLLRALGIKRNFWGGGDFWVLEALRVPLSSPSQTEWVGLPVLPGGFLCPGGSPW